MFIKQGKTNWKYILIVMILAVIVGGGVLRWIDKQDFSIEFPEIKKPEKTVTSQQIILSDEEVGEILKEFAQKRTISFNDIGADKILLDALEFRDTDIKNRVQELIRKFEDLELEIQDAPDLRSWKVQRTKVCIAESIVFNDLGNATQRCGYEQGFSFLYVDDLLADTQVLPFFVNGFAYYYKRNYSRAGYYFDQIKLHYNILKDIEYVDLNVEYLEIYNKIYNKALEVSSEVVKDETATWKTYRNEEYGFEVKYPTDWIVEENYYPWYGEGMKNFGHLNSARFGQIIEIHNYDNTHGLLLNQWLDSYTNYTNCIFTDRERILVTEIEGIKGNHACGDIVYEGIFLPKGNRIYNINLTRMVTEYAIGDEETDKVFNQMLSTFRFLD